MQGGPAVVAAIASGSADVGYASPVPPINARLNGINVKMVMALGHEVELLQAYDETVGHAGAILHGPTGAFEGGFDPRSDGGVAAF